MKCEFLLVLNSEVSFFLFYYEYKKQQIIYIFNILLYTILCFQLVDLQFSYVSKKNLD